MYENEVTSKIEYEDIFENYINIFANQYYKEKELFSSPKYIMWLNEFTKKYESFSDDDWLYESEKISAKDLEQVKYLGTIFNGVEAYANKNYIFSKSNDLGEYYSIKLEDAAYEIIQSSFGDSVYSCRRVELTDDIDVIDFNDIISNKKRELAIEIDKTLIPILDKTLGELDNIKIINDDFLKLDTVKLIDDNFGNIPVSVCANLPYYITTPIIMKFIDEDVFPDKFVIMIQKEVGDRFCAKEGSKDYSSILKEKSVPSDTFSKYFFASTSLTLLF